MTIKNIFIIDSRVTNYQNLITGLPADSEAFVLDSGQDGIVQMQAILANRGPLDSIQIVSHGAQGALYLGNTLLNSGNIDNYRSPLGDIGSSLTATGDLLLYGCNVAQGDEGRHFIDRLAQLTGADVAASEDWTGNAASGGNWALEAAVGVVETAPQAWGHDGVLGLTVSENEKVFTGHTSGEIRNQESFAALKSDGSVITWGSAGFGGDSSNVASKLDGTIDTKQIYSSFSAFAALRADGSVVTWGDPSGGGDSSSVADKLDGTIGVEKIYSARHAFAVLRADGSVVTWGNSTRGGGDSSSVANELVNVKQIYSTNFSFAALRTDGSVVTWGELISGGNSSNVADKLDGTIAVEKIYSTGHAFAALRADGSVVAWGWSPAGGDSSNVANMLDGSIDVKQVVPSYWSFAALRADGSVVTWGLGTDGGDSSSVASKLDGTVDVLRIYSTDGAFVALRADGSVVTWGNPGGGGDSSGVADKLDGTISVEKIYSAGHAFAALRADGSVVTWGSAASGGDSSSVANELVNVKQIYSSGLAFAALRVDGSVVTWGDSASGGDSSSVASALDGTVDVTQIYTTHYSFAALRADGSVVTWGDAARGGDSSSVASQLSSGVVGLADIYTDDVYTVDSGWQITPNARVVSEADGAIEFTITRPNDRTGTAETVYVSTTQNHGSVNTNDYAGLLNLPHSFAVGETSKTVTVDILADGVTEPDETFGLIVQTNPTDPISISLASTTFTISENALPPTNLPPTAQPVSSTKNLQPGQSIPLSELFTWNDPNGTSDVVSFAVRDRGIGGGYLTENNGNGVDGLQDDQLFDNVPITDIANWAFVAGEAGSADDVAFNAIDAAGESSTPAAVATVTATTANTKASATSFELEFFARQVAYGYEPLLKRPRIDDKNPGDILPSGHFAAGWELEKEFTTPDGLFRAVALRKDGFEPVLAIRGTEMNFADWRENTHELGAGGREFETAWNASNGIKQWLMSHPNASITGHSQGGAQAQMLAYEAAKHNATVTIDSDKIVLGQLITFNSPGINTNATSLAGTLGFNDVTHFISAGDVVSQVGEQFVPGNVEYYDFDYTGLNILLPLSAHTNHWAQNELYSAEFLRNESIYDFNVITPSTNNPNIAALNGRDFSYLTTYPNAEYISFKTAIVSFLAGAAPLALLAGLGPQRVSQILSNREQSELARTDDFPQLIDLLSDFKTVISELIDLGYTINEESLEYLASIINLMSNITSSSPLEVLRLSGSVLMNAFNLGYKTLSEVTQFAAAVFQFVGDFTNINLTDIKDYVEWNASLLVKLGDFVRDTTIDVLIKSLSVSKDFAITLLDRFSPDTPIPVVMGNNANSTPAVIVDGQVSDSTMTSASADSIYFVDDGNETINLTGDNNLIMGTPSAMDGTKVNNFKPSDTLFYFGANLKQSDLSAVKGSAILTLDTDGDGQGDSTVTLAGDFRLESFVVEASSSGSYIRYLGNAEPVAENDDNSVLPQGFATDEDSSFATANVLANDTDGDGDVLSIAALDTTGTLGLVTDNGDGTFNYDPNGAFDDLSAGEIATDSFSYTASDGNGGNDTATVTITINGVSHAPVANDDNGSVNEDSSVTFSFAQLFANDANVDVTNQTITAIDTTGTLGNVLIDHVNRTITYKADADSFDLLANGATVLDSFKYVLQGNSGETSTATVAINVTGVNDGKTLLGTVRRDTLNGTSGEDVIKGNNSNDIINGGDGADRLFGENGDDKLDGGNSIDTLSGGNGNDRLKGGNGDDSLIGGDGNDRLEGGLGNDWLKGEKGNDMLIGGAGSDIFAFARASGKDIVTDFIDGVDKIQITKNTGVTQFSQLNITSKTGTGDALYTTIDWGSSDKILLVGVSSDQLDATDFIFPV